MQLEQVRRLLALEAAADRAGASAPSAAAGRCYDKLTTHLTPLVGLACLQLLFARSAKLAKIEFPRFAEASLDESTASLGERLHGKAPAVAAEAAVALFGAFFTLLISFIGERLTNQVLSNAWPTFKETTPRKSDP